MSSELLAKKTADATALLASTTVTGALASTNSAAIFLPRPLNAAVFVLDVTSAATGAGDTLDCKVQTLVDGTNWVDVCYFTQVLGNGGAKRYIGKIICNTAQTMFADTALTAGNTRNIFGDQWRVNYVIASGTSAAFTFSVTAQVF